MAFKTRTARYILILVCTITQFIACSSSDDSAYISTLRKFRQSLTNTTVLDDWNNPTIQSLCIGNKSNFTGLLCDTNGTFIGLKLESMGLSGTIDVDSLSELPIQTFSMMNNRLSGPFPSGINKVVGLRALYLSHNNFSGEIPDNAFTGMKSMRKIVTGFNNFSGNIPKSLLELPKLVLLDMSNNGFEGKIPNFWQTNLTVNFANNRLEGVIPDVFTDQNASSFYGNADLCGAPLSSCKPKTIVRIAIIAGIVVGSLLSASIIVLLLCRKRRKPLKNNKNSSNNYNDKKIKNHTKTKNKDGGGGGVRNYENSTASTVITDPHGKVHFVRDDREKFELEHLLRASAEVLGSGSFGSSYKAIMPSGVPYVVRRFKHMNKAGKQGFHEHMRRLGGLNHPNLLPLVGFYYRKEEKLLITDYVDNGSLASHLHGKRSPNQRALDWPTRLKIIKGVAQGLSHLYKELPTLTLPHGHLKSSNVLLNSRHEPLLSDYSLAPVINSDHAHQFMVAYKSPESSTKQRQDSNQRSSVSRKTDVWSLGILILEILTGHFPANYLKPGRGPSADLATWVDSMVREEWTGEVFDKDMNLGRTNCEGPMLKLLKIGMCCCQKDVEKRWDLREAVDRIEELKDDDDDGCDYSSYVSEGDLCSSRALTDKDDDFSFSRASAKE